MVRAEKLTCIQCKLSKTRVFTSPTSLPDYQTRKGGGPCFYNFDTHACEGLVISEPIFVNAVSIEIRDTDSLNDLDKLKVIVFENDTCGINVGEIVTVNGDIQIQQNNSRGKGKAFPVMYCQSIKYENKDQLELTVLDIQAILRFKDRFPGPELIKRLVKMTANRVIGSEVLKEGILMAAANAKGDKPERRGRIHVLISGPPGLAKTALILESVKLVPNSSFDNAQTSTGLSLLAIVEKQEDTHILRLGPIPRARGAISAIDELNRMPFSDQEKLFGVMQEGFLLVINTV